MSHDNTGGRAFRQYVLLSAGWFVSLDSIWLLEKFQCPWLIRNPDTEQQVFLFVVWFTRKTFRHRKPIVAFFLMGLLRDSKQKISFVGCCNLVFLISLKLSILTILLYGPLLVIYQVKPQTVKCSFLFQPSKSSHLLTLKMIHRNLA